MSFLMVMNVCFRTLPRVANLSHGLYYAALPLASSPTCVAATSSQNKQSAIELIKLWHLRLGHLPLSQLKVLLPDVDVNNFTNTTFCTICPAARQTRRPFPISSIKTTKSFQLIHVDIWGLYRHDTYDGCNSFLTIVDDFTRSTWLYLLRSKKQYIDFLRQFYTYVETQFNSKIQIIRTDNAKELCDGDAKFFYSQHDILHQTSCRDTPQQNGVVKRKHHHLLEVARALSFQSNLPIRFWG